MLNLTNQEKELLYIIKNANDPVKALEVATAIIQDFLSQYGSSLKSSAGAPPAPTEKTK